MNIFVLYNKKSKPSAIALADLLKRDYENYKICRGVLSSKLIKKTVPEIIINVGNSEYSKDLEKFTIINHPKKIRISANKKVARMRFKAKKIPAPLLWLKASKIPKAEYPVVGRTTFHMKAKGFWFCKDYREAALAEKKGATHFMKFIDNTREFRVHIFSSKLNPVSKEDYIIAKLSEKKPTTKTETSIIKNHDHGYVFVAASFSKNAEINLIRTTAKETIYQFGLHYGAVDIMLSKETGKVFVLEINTTPCLTDQNSSTLDLYSTKLMQMIKESNAE